MYADLWPFNICRLQCRQYSVRLNQDLENAHNWLTANKVTINTTKTEFMLIASRQRLRTLTDSLTIAINDVQISHVITAKSLVLAIEKKRD